MSEKRYYSVDYDEQYYIFDSDVIRKGRVEEEAEYSYDVFANSMSSTEIIDKLNELTNENEQLKHKVNGLKSELAIWKEDANEHIQETNKLFEENNQLKKELTKFKEWEKHIGDVKREELDKVFKMSIYEIAEAFEYYQKRIKELEKENENLNNVLEDFMIITNRLQSEPDNKLLQGMARDMLRMMGKNIMGDSDE